MNAPSLSFDVAACATAHAFGDFWYCHGKNFAFCPYAFHFGYRLFCKHPDNRNLTSRDAQNQKHRNRGDL